MLGSHGLFHPEDHRVLRARRTAGAGERSEEPTIWHRDFVALFASRSLSSLGTGMAMVAIAYLIIVVTSGAIWIAFLAASYTATYAIGGVVDSFVGDRFDTRRLLWVGQGIEVVVDAALIVLWLSGDLNGVTLVALGAVSGFVSAFEYPAWQVLLREMLPATQLPRSIAVYASGRSAARLVGSLAAAVLLSFELVVPLFVIDIVTYLPVFATLWFLRDRRETDRSDSSDVAVAPDGEDAPSSAGEAVRYMLSDGTTRWTLVLIGMLALLVGPMTQMLGAAVDWLGTHPSLVGWLSAALYLGQTGQAGVISWAEKRGMAIGFRVAVMATVAAAVLILIGASQNPVVAVVGLVAYGAAFGAGKTVLLTVVDTVVPERLISRAVSLYVVTYSLGMLIGVLAWGVVSDKLSFGLTLVAVALGMVLFVAAATISRRVGLLDSDREPSTT